MEKYAQSLKPPTNIKTDPNAKVSQLDHRLENGGFFQSSVDLESLESLVDLEDLGEDVCDPEALDLHTEDGISSATRTDPSCAKDPQMITFYSASSNTSLRSSSFKDMFTSARDLLEILSRHGGNSIWWMDVQNPSDKTLRLLCSAFHVHPLTVEDIRMQETHEKMDHFPSYSFVCLRTFTVVTDESTVTYEPQTIYMVIFREGTLTFSYSKTQHNAHVLDRIAALQGYIPITQNWLFYAFV
jgi:Mg2+ and Co2+ transporter CorA